MSQPCSLATYHRVTIVFAIVPVRAKEAPVIFAVVPPSIDYCSLIFSTSYSLSQPALLLQAAQAKISKLSDTCIPESYVAAGRLITPGLSWTAWAWNVRRSTFTTLRATWSVLLFSIAMKISISSPLRAVPYAIFLTTPSNGRATADPSSMSVWLAPA